VYDIRKEFYKIKKIFLLFFTWRILLWIPVIVGYFYLPIRKGYDYILFSDYILRASPFFHFTVNPFANFDGVHYLTIASQGYTVNAGFFPLFPILIRTITTVLIAIIPLQIDIVLFYVGLILNAVLLLLGLYAFNKLLRLDYKENIASQSIFFLLAFPTSFFFAAVYSESLFFFLTILIFYFARKKNWIIVAVCGCLLSATRPVGIAIIPAILYELIRSEKVSASNVLGHFFKFRKLWFKTIAISITIFSGIGAYSIFNYVKWKDPIFFIHVQGAFLNHRSVSSFIFFPQTIVRYIKIFITVSPTQYDWWIALFELSIFLIASFLLFYAWKKKVRSSYLIFSLLCLLIPVSTGTFSGVPRYTLVLFPIFIALALSTNKMVKAIYSFVSILLLGILFMLFSRGYFVA